MKRLATVARADSLSSPSDSLSSCSDDDDELLNHRCTPIWALHRHNILSRGFALETVRDVQELYRNANGFIRPDFHTLSYLEQHDSNAICPDRGLPDNLFRGKRLSDGRRVVIKAVHPRSRELSIIQFLTSPHLRTHPMNHCIPVLDLIQVPCDNVAFIVMEEWSSQFIDNQSTCCLKRFLVAIEQIIEHATFMHQHNIVHLDISLRNILTNYRGEYAFIDFERSYRFDGNSPPLLRGPYKGTEVPPDTQSMPYYDPFKVDVWALGVLILRACKLTGHFFPELMDVVRPMLHNIPSQRPTLQSVLTAFRVIAATVASHQQEECHAETNQSSFGFTSSDST